VLLVRVDRGPSRDEQVPIAAGTAIGSYLVSANRREASNA
jgi:hypothetical protein